MLVLTRRVSETIVIDGGIRVTVLEVRGNKIKLGIVAPKHVSVDREEVSRARADWADTPTPVQLHPNRCPGDVGADLGD